MKITFTHDFKWFKAGQVVECRKAIGYGLITKGVAKSGEEADTPDEGEDETTPTPTPTPPVVDPPAVKEAPPTIKKKRGRPRKNQG